MSNFIKVGSIKDIPPGESRVFYVRGHEIAVFNVEGTFYALDSLCPHQGGPLVAGTVEGKVLTCPWHSWQFDLATGVSPANPSICTRTYPVKILNNDIRIKIEGEPSPIL